VAKEFLGRVVEQARAQGADQRRTLYRRWHTARGLSEHEELASQSRKAVAFPDDPGNPTVTSVCRQLVVP
jgi:hypothetical protein